MSITPFQAGLGAFIDLNKPDFIGKAALLDADRRPLLYGLKCASATPDSQAEIMDNGICVGDWQQQTSNREKELQPVRYTA